MGKLGEAMRHAPTARRTVGEEGIVSRISDGRGSYFYRVRLPAQQVVIDFRKERRRDMLLFLRDAGCPATGRWYPYMSGED